MIILAGRYSICQPRIHNRDRQSLQSLCYSRRRKNLHRWGFLYTRIHSHTCGCLHIFETRSWWMAVWRMMIRKQERCCCCFSLFYPEATTVDNRQQSHKKEMRAAVVGCLSCMSLCVCAWRVRLPPRFISVFLIGLNFERFFYGKEWPVRVKFYYQSSVLNNLHILCRRMIDNVYLCNFVTT